MYCMAVEKNTTNVMYKINNYFYKVDKTPYIQTNHINLTRIV